MRRSCVRSSAPTGRRLRAEAPPSGAADHPTKGPRDAAKRPQSREFGDAVDTYATSAPKSAPLLRYAKAPPSGAADHSTKAPRSGAADHSTKAPPSGAADYPTRPRPYFSAFRFG